MNKYIKFQQSGDTGKTKTWDVVTINEKTFLGQIRWYYRWREYCFYPFDNTVFALNCIKDIASFIELQMKARKDERTYSKKNS